MTMNPTEYSRECALALENLIATINIDARLPEYVFRGTLSKFYLFDPDWMFEDAFIAKISSLRSIEGSSCACLVNLDRLANSDEAVMFINNQTTAEVYQDLLRGSSPCTGWVYDFDRFACISEKGAWCIYCERANELAIIGFQKDVLHEKYKPVLESLKAGYAGPASQEGNNYELSPHIFSEKWKEEIFCHYGQHM